MLKDSLITGVFFLTFSLQLQVGYTFFWVNLRTNDGIAALEQLFEEDCNWNRNEVVTDPDFHKTFFYVNKDFHFLIQDVKD